MSFRCSICEQESTRICVYCTKDACHNHVCDRCARCSDCCECDMSVGDFTHEAPPVHAATPPAPNPEPEPPHPPPDPDPAREEPVPATE